MPAQIFVSKAQIAEIAKLDEDVVLVEAPSEADALTVWVCEEHNNHTSHHREVILDSEGTTLSDMELGDTEGP